MVPDTGVHDAQRLKELQALPLYRKIQITQTRIIEWYQHYEGRVYVSFSGGKDSTVLLHIARQIYPNIPAVFANTGLEFGSIQRFVRSWDNVLIVTPKMRFDEVISTYGYPLIGKEVAEAIYYARRIRSQTVNVEREREREREATGQRKRVELAGDRTWRTGAKRIERYESALDGKIPTEVRPAETTARRDAGNQRANQPSQTSRGRWNTYEPRERYRWVLSELRSAAGVEEFKSQFNKEKWLPLVELPFLISHYCCNKVKKEPIHRYQKQHGYHPIIATLAEESRIRKQGWIRTGCNIFNGKNPKSQPMSFWTEQDVLTYLVDYNVPLADIYGDIIAVDADGNTYTPQELLGNSTCKLQCSGCKRTGCVYCGFGAHIKGDKRFLELAKLEPRKYEYAMGGGQWVDNPHYDATAPEYDGEWRNWNPKKIWVPSKQGLGLAKVFDMVNEIYGQGFIQYE